MRYLRLVIVVAFLLLVVAPPAFAQAPKDYYWDYINTDITVNLDGSFNVVETQKYVFTQGSFRFATRYIPLDRVEDVTDVMVLEGATPYKLVKAETEGGYTAVKGDGQLNLEWWYPASSNTSRTFTLKYTVRGGLRIYDGGDQLWWVAVFPDRQKAVRSSTVTVRLPAGMDPAVFKTESYFTKADVRVVDARTIVFTAGTVAANTLWRYGCSSRME
jgi:hypothetical protein